VKTTKYFDHTRKRPDRASIDLKWIKFTMSNYERKEIQTDGRVRLWAKIIQNENRYLRVILLEDSETVHNAFFDRSFKGKENED